MRSADSQLSYLVMSYAIQALGEGDLKAIEDLDFTVDEVRQLAELPVKALKHFAQLSGHFLEVKTDHSCFDKMMSHLKIELEQETLQDNLIHHQAPIAMMTTLFGMSVAEYIQRQKLLGIPQQGAGRPPMLSDDDQEVVWKVWRNIKEGSTAERYLAVARQTRHPLRSLWSLIQSWENLNLKQFSAVENRE